MVPGISKHSRKGTISLMKFIIASVLDVENVPTPCNFKSSGCAGGSTDGLVVQLEGLGCLKGLCGWVSCLAPD